MMKPMRERWIEFFEDGDTGRSMLSMSRLLTFLAFWPSSWVVIKNPTEGIFAIYLGAFALLYVGGKWGDAKIAAKTNTGVIQADVVVTDQTGGR